MLALSILRDVLSGCGMSIWDRKNISILCAVFSCFIFSMLDFSFDAPAHVITFFLLTSLLIQDGSEKDQIHGKISQIKLATHGIVHFAHRTMSMLLLFHNKSQSCE